MDNIKDKRKKKIIKISAMLGLFLLVLGLSYALFSIALVGKKKVKIKSAKLDVEIKNEENPIDLDGALPETDEAGANEVPYEFDLVNNGSVKVNYDLYLKISQESDMPWNALSYNLKVGSTFLAQNSNLMSALEHFDDYLSSMTNTKKHSVTKLGTSHYGVGESTLTEPIEYYRGTINGSDVVIYEYDDGEFVDTGKRLSYSSISYNPFNDLTLDEKEYQYIEYTDVGTTKGGYVLKHFCNPIYKYYRIFDPYDGDFDAIKIDSSSITAGETKHYSLQMWIFYDVGNNAMDKTFEAHAYVFGKQDVQ